MWCGEDFEILRSLAMSAAPVSCCQNIKKCQTETEVDYGPNDPTDIMMGLLFIMFPNGACLQGLLSWSHGHLMPWRPKWDMAKKNLKLGWAMGLRSLQDAGLP